MLGVLVMAVWLCVGWCNVDQASATTLRLASAAHFDGGTRQDAATVPPFQPPFTVAACVRQAPDNRGYLVANAVASTTDKRCFHVFLGGTEGETTLFFGEHAGGARQALTAPVGVADGLLHSVVVAVHAQQVVVFVDGVVEAEQALDEGALQGCADGVVWVGARPPGDYFLEGDVVALEYMSSAVDAVEATAMWQQCTSASASPTPSPSASPTPSPSASTSVTPSTTPSYSTTPSTTPTATLSPSPSPSPSASVPLPPFRVGATDPVEYYYFPAKFGDSIFDVVPLQGALKVAEPDAYACSPLPAASYNSSIVLALRGVCPFVTKAQHAAAANATLVVINNDDRILVMVLPDNSTEDDFPNLGLSVSVQLSVGQTLLQLVEDAKPLAVPAIFGDPPPPYVDPVMQIGAFESSEWAEEAVSDGACWVSSSDLEFPFDTGEAIIVGMRFPRVVVPANAVVTRATLLFVVDEPTATTTAAAQSNLTLTVGVQALASAASPFSPRSFDVSSRSLLPVHALWQPAPWGAAGSLVSGPDVTDLVQLVVESEEWVVGGDVVVVVSASEETLGSGSFDRSDTRVAKSGLEGNAPQLVVEFTAPPCNDAWAECSEWTGRDCLDEGVAEWVRAECSGACGLCAELAGTADNPAVLTADIAVGWFVETTSSGSFNASTDLELPNDGEDQVVTLFFPFPAALLESIHAAEPPEILEAYVQFQCDEVSEGEVVLDIYGLMHDGSTGTSTPTVASVAWSPADWVVEGEAAQAQRTPSLKALVQEVAAQARWRDGAVVAGLELVLERSAVGGGDGSRTAESGVQGGAPWLHLSWTHIPVERDVSLAASQWAEESLTTGEVSLSSSDLELPIDYGEEQIVGLRFATPPFPLGAQIRTARLHFTTDEATTGNVVLEVALESSARPAAFTTSAFGLSSRPRNTTTAVQWGPSAWYVVGRQERGGQLRSLLQATIDASTWTGQDLVFLLRRDPSDTGVEGRVAESGLDGNPPVLVASYTNSPCSDNAWFEDEKGFTCGWWRGLSCGSVATALGFSTAGVRDLLQNCAVVCNVCEEPEPLPTSPPSPTPTATPLPGDSTGIVVTARMTGELFQTIVNNQSVPYTTTASADLDLGWDTTLSQHVTVFLEFLLPAVPPLATVTAATLQLQASDASSGTLVLDVCADASAPQADFVEEGVQESTRDETTVCAEWNVPDWQVQGESGAPQRSPDLSRVVQEVVGQEGWGTGDSASRLVLTVRRSRNDHLFHGRKAQSEGVTLSLVVRSNPTAVERTFALEPSLVPSTTTTVPTNDMLVFGPVPIPPSTPILFAQLSLTPSAPLPALALCAYSSASSSCLPLVSVPEGSTSPILSGDISEVVEGVIAQGGWDGQQLWLGVQHVVGGTSEGAGLEGHVLVRGTGAPALRVVFIEGVSSFSASPSPSQTATHSPSSSRTPSPSPSPSPSPLVFSTEATSVAEDAAKLTSVASLTSSDLDMAHDNGLEQVVALRFSGLPFRHNLTGVLHASVQFTAKAPCGGNVRLRLCAEAHASPRPFSSSEPNNVSARECAKATVDWEPPEWTAASEASLAQQTPDLAELVAEAMGLEGWDGTLVLLVRWVDGDRNSTRRAESGVGGGGTPPLLVVGYTTEVGKLEVAATSWAQEQFPFAPALLPTHLDLCVAHDRPQAVAVRFDAVSLPSNISVSRAWLQFTAAQVDAGAATIEISLESTIFPEPFRSVSGSVWNRTSGALTTEAVAWPLQAWRRPGETGASQQTPDIGAAVDDLVRAWDAHGVGAGDRALVAVLSLGEGAATSSRVAVGVGGAPTLHVVYTT